MRDASFKCGKILPCLSSLVLVLGLTVHAYAADTNGAADTAQSSAVAEQAPAVLEEPDTLTLPDALALALNGSPVLAAFTWDIRAADAMIQRAGLRPNPELGVEIEDIRWSAGPSETTRSTSLAGAVGPGGFGAPALDFERETVQGAHSGLRESEVTISIAQEIELGRKRAKRVVLAERQKELVLWDYHAARADVLAKTASDFVAVLAAHERLNLQRELVELTEEIVRTISLRVKAGQVSPLELSRAEVALATERAAREESLRELEAARAVLASNWGSKRAQFSTAVGELSETRPLPSFEELQEAIAANPDVARWAAELETRRASWALERAQRIPDLTVELGFRSTGLAGRKATQYGFGTGGDFGVSRAETGYSEDRDNSLVLGFSLPLPVFDRNQGSIAAAEAMLEKAGEERRGTETAVHAELISAHQSASGAYAAARILQEEVMPKVAETFEKMQRGYEQGKFGYLEVLDTQRSLFDSREAYIGFLVRYHQAIVRIERLTGQTLEELGRETGQNIEDASHE